MISNEKSNFMIIYVVITIDDCFLYKSCLLLATEKITSITPNATNIEMLFDNASIKMLDNET